MSGTEVVPKDTKHKLVFPRAYDVIVGTVCQQVVTVDCQVLVKLQGEEVAQRGGGRRPAWAGGAVLEGSGTGRGSCSGACPRSKGHGGN